MDKPRCKTCPYWDNPGGEEDGWCNRHAPRPAVVPYYPSDDARPATDAHAYWPAVDGLDWCGEHPDFPEYLERLKRAQFGG